MTSFLRIYIDRIRFGHIMKGMFRRDINTC